MNCYEQQDFLLKMGYLMKLMKKVFIDGIRAENYVDFVKI